MADLSKGIIEPEILNIELEVTTKKVVHLQTSSLVGDQCKKECQMSQ